MHHHLLLLRFNLGAHSGRLQGPTTKNPVIQDLYQGSFAFSEMAIQM